MKDIDAELVAQISRKLAISQEPDAVERRRARRHSLAAARTAKTIPEHLAARDLHHELAAEAFRVGTAAAVAASYAHHHAGTLHDQAARESAAARSPMFGALARSTSAALYHPGDIIEDTLEELKAKAAELERAFERPEATAERADLRRAMRDLRRKVRDLARGDRAGHPFYGNQWTGGQGEANAAGLEKDVHSPPDPYGYTQAPPGGPVHDPEKLMALFPRDKPGRTKADDPQGDKCKDVLNGEQRKEYERFVKWGEDEVKAGRDSEHMFSETRKDSQDNVIVGDNGKPVRFYQPDVQEQHDRIKADYEKKFRAAIPPPGTQPTLILLGGRGGSGKSQFGKPPLSVYDEKDPSFVKIDCDEIKKRLPGYSGPAAPIYHEESSALMKEIVNNGRRKGANIVLDITMANTFDDKYLKPFRDAGYRIEGHYMALPMDEAGERAVMRWANPNSNDGVGPMEGRLVPAYRVYEMTDNEKNFVKASKKFDAWTAYSNKVPYGQPPVLLGIGGHPRGNHRVR